MVYRFYVQPCVYTMKLFILTGDDARVRLTRKILFDSHLESYYVQGDPRHCLP